MNKYINIINIKNIYVCALSISLFLFTSCREKKSNLSEIAPKKLDTESLDSLLPSDSLELFKRRRSRPDFENHVLITTKEQADIVFKRYYDEMLINMNIPKDGLSDVKMRTDGYFYSQIIGGSWYIFVKQGDKFIFDGGFSVH